MLGKLNKLINLTSTTVQNLLSSIIGDNLFAAGSVAALMFASLVFSISSKKRKELKIESNDSSSETAEAAAAAGTLRRSDDDEFAWKSSNDLSFHEDVTVSESDAKYAEELQVQEALLASLFTSQMAHTVSTSTSKARESLSSLLKNQEREVEEPPNSFCEICLENKDAWQMFKNPTCSHSFCFGCTSKHATSKIQENTDTITCPAVNCKSWLDFDACRLIVPKEILIKWDELLCKSTILESHKFYCPFTDCSVLMVNDNNSSGITRTDCPVCRRSFCAACRVPWHSEFTCKEFEKLNAKKKGKKEDEMTEALAKKKKWRKCPSCKFFVEKTEGCLHITCRCKYEFCYRCGAKWSSSHGGCRLRS